MRGALHDADERALRCGFTIQGANVGASPAVRLVRDGNELIGKVIAQTPPTIVAEMILNGSSSGGWKLVIENADGTRVEIPQAFALPPPSGGTMGTTGLTGFSGATSLTGAAGPTGP